MCLLLVKTQAQVWIPRANVGGPGREYAVAFSIGNKGYIATGYDGSSNGRNDLWEYEPLTDTWTQKASMPDAGRIYAVGFSIGNKGYVGTGDMNDFWEWNQANDTWTKRADFPGGARSRAIAFSIGNKGYIGMGASGNPCTCIDFWEWNGDTASAAFDTWTQRANFIGGNGRRSEAVCFSIGKKGYVATGDGQLSNYKELWEYDGDTASATYDMWIQKANFGGTGRYAAAGFAIGMKGYVGTGNDTDSLRSDFWEWDQLTDTWSQKVNFSGTARFIAVGLSIGNKGYIGVGNDYGSGYLNDFWEYCDTCSNVNGIEDISSNDFFVYPNPCQNRLRVVSTNKSLQDLKLFDLYGKEILLKAITKNEYDVSELAEGLYFLEIETQQGFLRKKVVIKR